MRTLRQAIEVVANTRWRLVSLGSTGRGKWAAQSVLVGHNVTLSAAGVDVDHVLKRLARQVEEYQRGLGPIGGEGGR